MLLLLDALVTVPSTEMCAVRLADRILSFSCAFGLAAVPPALLITSVGTAARMGLWNGAL